MGDTMDSIARSLLGITLIIFMVGSLLEVGLRLRPREAFGAIRNPAFVSLSTLWGFVLCPALAVALTRIIPLSEPYALGMIFLGMTPCAPFFPAMAEKAGGDLAYTAAFLIVAVAGTVIFMPVATPLLLPGFEANPWTIAKPLVLYIAIPLALGICTRNIGAAFAPLIAVPDTEPEAIAMVALAVPLTVLFAALIARGLARLAPTDDKGGWQRL